MPEIPSFEDGPLGPGQIQQTLAHVEASARVMGAHFQGLVASGVPAHLAAKMTHDYFRQAAQDTPSSNPVLDALRGIH